MNDLLSWPALIFFGYMAGYIFLAVFTAKLAKEEGFELPPAGLGLVAVLMMAWPVLLVWSALEAARQRSR